MSSQNNDSPTTGEVGDKAVDDFNVNINDQGDDTRKSPRSGDNQRPRGRGRGRGRGDSRGEGRGRGDRGFGGGWRGGRGRGGGFRDRTDRPPRNSESRDKERNQNDSRETGEQLSNGGNEVNGAVNGEKRYPRRFRGRDNRENRSGGGWRRENRRTPRNSESNADGSRAETSRGEGAKGGRPRRAGYTRFTHFLSLPFNTKPIQDKFAEFKAQVLEKYGSDENAFIGEDLFQNPARIHLTFGIMQLDNEEQEKTAIALLEKCIDEIARPALAGSPLNIKIVGVGNLLNKRSGKARVVFAKVTEGAEKLQEIANKITQKFVDENIVIYDTGNEDNTDVSVLLHITLMNTTFRERLHRKKPSFYKLPRPKQFFDAQQLLEDFNEFVFADQLNVDSLHISNARRFTTDGFYEPLAIVPIAEGVATIVTPKPPPKEKPQKEAPTTPEKSGSGSADSTSPQATATTPVSN